MTQTYTHVEHAAADLLIEAAYQLDEKGWCKGVFRDPEGRMCAVGAMHDAVETLPSGMRYRAFDFACREVASTVGTLEKYGPLSPAVVKWNDSCSDASEVTEKLRYVAQQIRNTS